MTPLADLKKRYDGGYLGDASIKHNATFRFLSDWGGHVLVKKDDLDVPVVLHGIFKVAFQNYFFTPTAGFQIGETPSWQSSLADHTAFAETRASVLLHTSDIVNNPEEWKSYTGNLTTLQSLFIPNTGSRGSVVNNDGLEVELTTRFIIPGKGDCLAGVGDSDQTEDRGNTADEVDDGHSDDYSDDYSSGSSVSSDDDEAAAQTIYQRSAANTTTSKAANPGKDLRSETPAELTLAGWPLPDSLSHLRDKLIEENKWDIDPLALYDEADEEKRLILPQQYETLLRGATVHAAFHLIGWRVKETGGAFFNLEVKEITVLKKPDPNLAEELMRSAPKKPKGPLTKQGRHE